MNPRDERPDSGHADPERIAHFRVLGRLGQGGMGVVYRAEDEKLRRTVALKLLTDTSGNEERRQRFLREARSAAAVTHPNVAVVYQVDEADGRVYIAMELVEGENLRRKLERGRLDLATARDIALQVTRGLAAAHEKGIVHRDLKPENVMITPAGAVKLLDFGLAKAGIEGPVTGKTEAAMAETETAVTSGQGRIMGTPEYMSPEQAIGDPVDVRSDVFSLGIVLYELFSGARPFGGHTTGALLIAIARDVPPPLRKTAPDVDARMAAVVMRCLAKAPRERFSSAGEVAAALSGESPVKAGRRISVAAWAAVLVVVAAAVAGVWASSRPRAPVARPVPAGTVAPHMASRGDTMSRSSNPEAQRLFEEALRSFHDGLGHERELLERAVRADPTFGGAYLRLSMVSFGDDRVAPFRTALDLQSAMTPSERELMTVVDPTAFLWSSESDARLDAYLARHPEDTMAWYLRVRVPDSVPQCARALAVDPTLAPVIAFEALRLDEQGRDEEAERLVGDCLARVPFSELCLRARAEVLAAKGNCMQALLDARRLSNLEPASQEAQDLVVSLAAAEGESEESLQMSIGSLDASTSHASSYGAFPRAVSLPLLAGDFVLVERVGQELRERLAAGTNTMGEDLATNAVVVAYTESGDLAGAARVAMDGKVRGKADMHIPSFTVAMSRAMARGGLERDQALRGIDSLYRAIQPPCDAGVGCGDLGAWAETYASGVVTRSEALASVAVLDGFHGDPMKVPARRGETGEVLFLAGRGEQARHLLEEAIRDCQSVLGDPPLLMHAELDLGELDETAGDTTSACSHYALVLNRWGHAKPRSVTADEARARSRALACPP